MVSKAREDLPEPDRPVKTMSALRGSSMETFFRLCSRAPRTTSLSIVTKPQPLPLNAVPSLKSLSHHANVQPLQIEGLLPQRASDQ